MNLRKMSDKDLIDHFKQLHNAITVSNCFGTNDITEHLKAGEELLERGYVVDITESVNIHKYQKGK